MCSITEIITILIGIYVPPKIVYSLRCFLTGVHWSMKFMVVWGVDAAGRQGFTAKFNDKYWAIPQSFINL